METRDLIEMVCRNAWTWAKTEARDNGIPQRLHAAKMVCRLLELADDDETQLMELIVNAPILNNDRFASVVCDTLDDMDYFRNV